MTKAGIDALLVAKIAPNGTYGGMAMMAHLHEQGERGLARVEHFTLDVEQSLATVEMEAERQFPTYTPPATYCKLEVFNQAQNKWQIMMTDVRMERLTNKEFLNKANGNVLVAGLGLGMVLTHVLRKRNVASVTVVELLPEVIELILPGLFRWDDKLCAKKLKVVQGNIFEFPTTNSWDTIYFDIWPEICPDNLPETARLLRRFRHSLNRDNPKAWMGAWMRNYLNWQRRRANRHARETYKLALNAYLQHPQVFNEITDGARLCFITEQGERQITVTNIKGLIAQFQQSIAAGLVLEKETV